MAREIAKVIHQVLGPNDEVQAVECHTITVRPIQRPVLKKVFERFGKGGKELTTSELGLSSGMSLQEETALAGVVDWTARVQDGEPREVQPLERRSLLSNFDYFATEINESIGRAREKTDAERKEALGNF